MRCFLRSAAGVVEGKAYWGSVFRGFTDEKEWGLIKAMDPLTAETKWEFRLNKAPWSGVLSTAGGVLFATALDGYLMALDQDGQAALKFNTGFSPLKGSPITFEIGGRQYLTMGSGASVITFALAR